MGFFLTNCNSNFKVAPTRKDEALDDLWENIVATGINFAKYGELYVNDYPYPYLQ